tara:strand:+ start:337 stop:915 length:579 start_codon:yes stop_codon:yes gene_type:complete
MNKINNLKNNIKPDQDKKYTNPELAKKLINLVDIKKHHILLDPFRGRGAFYDNFPEKNHKYWCEIDDGVDFFDFDKKVHWVITNPPYSCINKVFDHLIKICDEGFALLLGMINLSVKRIKYLETNGFFITKIHLVRVRGWFGTSCFVVWRKNKKPILSYDDDIYSMPDDQEKIYKNYIKNYNKNYYINKKNI